MTKAGRYNTTVLSKDCYKDQYEMTNGNGDPNARYRLHYNDLHNGHNHFGHDPHELRVATIAALSQQIKGKSRIKELLLSHKYSCGVPCISAMADKGKGKGTYLPILHLNSLNS